jgi:hypothetical protein
MPSFDELTGMAGGKTRLLNHRVFSLLSTAMAFGGVGNSPKELAKCVLISTPACETCREEFSVRDLKDTTLTEQ